MVKTITQERENNKMLGVELVIYNDTFTKTLGEKAS